MTYDTTSPAATTPAKTLASRRFTLIELLVVVAIIAILASMLLPSLNQARRKALSVRCLGNMKQQGTAMQFYADEMDDFIPFSRTPTNAPAYTQYVAANNPAWFTRVAEYIGATPTSHAGLEGDKPALFHCPAWDPQEVVSVTMAPPLVVASDAKILQPDGTYNGKITDVLQPETKVWLLEGNQSFYFNTAIPGSLLPTGYARYNHSLRMNIPYFDLHAAPAPLTTLTDGDIDEFYPYRK